MKSRFLTTAALAVALAATATAAMADEVVKKPSDELMVNMNGGAPALTVKNMSNSNQLSDLKLAVMENHASIDVSMEAQCGGVYFENFRKRNGSFLSGGAFGVGDSVLIAKKDLPSSSNINHLSDSDATTFDLSPNLLNNALGIDPVTIVMAAANQAPSKIGYLRQDHSFEVDLPIRAEAHCDFYHRDKIKKTTEILETPLSYAVKNVKLSINYEGDPDLYELNAQIADANQNGGIQAGEQNFINVTGGIFLLDGGGLHKKGHCPMQQNFTLLLTGSGDGQVKIRINEEVSDENGLPMAIENFTSPPLDFNQGQVVYNFASDLKRIAPQHLLDHKYDHKYRVYYSAKKNSDAFFPANYQSLPLTLNWSHTCSSDPVINPSLKLPDQGGVKYGNSDTGQEGKPARAGTLKVNPLQPQPVDPKPSRATGEDDTKPTLQVKPLQPKPGAPKPSRSTGEDEGDPGPRLILQAVPQDGEE